MADLRNVIRVENRLVVALRRFAAEPLSGNDLMLIRTTLLDMTQAELGNTWGISRNQVSRIENQHAPDSKTCDAYIGLMVRSLIGSAESKGSKP